MRESVILGYLSEAGRSSAFSVRTGLPSSLGRPLLWPQVRSRHCPRCRKGTWPRPHPGHRQTGGLGPHPAHLLLQVGRLGTYHVRLFEDGRRDPCTDAESLHSVWGPLGSGVEPVSPALAGGVFTKNHRGSPGVSFLWRRVFEIFPGQKNERVCA